MKSCRSCNEHDVQKFYLHMNESMFLGNFYEIVDGGMVDLMISIILNYSIFKEQRENQGYSKSGDMVGIILMFIFTVLVMLKFAMDVFVVRVLYLLQKDLDCLV